MDRTSTTPFKVPTGLSDSASQNRIVPISSAVTSRFPSGENVENESGAGPCVCLFTHGRDQKNCQTKFPNFRWTAPVRRQVNFKT